MFAFETQSNGEQRLRFLNQLPRPLPMQFGTWDELRRWLESLPRGVPLWRGIERFAWPLESKLQRALRDVGIPERDWPEVERAAFARFNALAAPFLDGSPHSDQLARLALMQHHGAPTRLTDWSTDPFVALFFAYRAQAETDRALFGLDPRFCQSVYGVRDPSASDDLTESELVHLLVEEPNARLDEATIGRVGWPLVLPALVESPRMRAQHAAFVCDATLRSPLELLLADGGWEAAKSELRKVDISGRWFVAGSSNPHFVHREHVMQKIKLPSAWRDEVLACIGGHGITEGQLFPDRRGVEDPLDRIGAQVERLVQEWPTRERPVCHESRARAEARRSLEQTD